MWTRVNCPLNYDVNICVFNISVNFNQIHATLLSIVYLVLASDACLRLDQIPSPLTRQPCNVVRLIQDLALVNSYSQKLCSKNSNRTVVYSQTHLSLFCFHPIKHMLIMICFVTFDISQSGRWLK